MRTQANLLFPIRKQLRCEFRRPCSSLL